MSLKKKIIICFTVLIAFFTSYSCNKKSSKCLPPITQNGANTFGCKIDGEIYAVTGIYESNSVSCGEGNQVLIGFEKSINSSNCDDYINFNDITITLMDSLQIGNFQLTYFGKNRATAYKTLPTVYYTTDTSHNGGLKITRSDNIIAGTFWFDAKGNDGTTIHVTDGRFDITKQ